MAIFPGYRATAIENSHDDPSAFHENRTGLFKVSSRKFDESIERYYSVPPSCRPSSAFFNHSKRINHPSRGPRSLQSPPGTQPRRFVLPRPDSSRCSSASERRYQRRPFPTGLLSSRSWKCRGREKETNSNVSPIPSASRNTRSINPRKCEFRPRNSIEELAGGGFRGEICMP